MKLYEPKAIFLDSNIFIGECYNFNSGVLKFLQKHVEFGTVALYLNNIVVAEVKKHIARDVAGAANKLIKVSNEKISTSKRKVKHGIAIFKEMDKYKSVFSLKELSEKEMIADAVDRFDKYLRGTDADILSNENINIENVLSSYFESKPPFEEKEDKKAEFPDAIMAERLKQLAVGKEVIVISDDDGFRDALVSVKGIYLI